LPLHPPERAPADRQREQPERISQPDDGRDAGRFGVEGRPQRADPPVGGELRRDRVLVNAICPGWTATDMGGGGRRVAEGAASVVWAVLLPDEGPTGGFFQDGRPLSW
jgi:hypothetical protein